jgi:hypothetical protein
MKEVQVGSGAFLLVFSDVKHEDDQDYFRWLTTEHVEERLGIPGFLAVRIFKTAIPGGNRYFIWYQLENADVVDSAGYLERLNNPTPWSQRIMPILGNFGRGGGAVTARRGEQPGAYAVTVGLEKVPADANAVLQKIEQIPGVVSLYLLETNLQKTTVQTSERELRKGDKSFAGWLVIEVTDRDALMALPMAISGLADGKDENAIGGPYRQVFSR